MEARKYEDRVLQYMSQTETETSEKKRKRNTKRAKKQKKQISDSSDENSGKKRANDSSLSESDELSDPPQPQTTQKVRRVDPPEQTLDRSTQDFVEPAIAVPNDIFDELRKLVAGNFCLSILLQFEMIFFLAIENFAALNTKLDIITKELEKMKIAMRQIQKFMPAVINTSSLVFRVKGYLPIRSVDDLIKFDKIITEDDELREDFVSENHFGIVVLQIISKPTILFIFR